MKVFGVVYLIWNMFNGKKYVGQTVKTVELRFKEHAWGEHTVIGRAIRKYGKENFRYGVLKSCASKDEMDYWEKYFIVALRTKLPMGYNCTNGGEGIVGLERTPEHCRKISEALKGIPKSYEARMRMSKAHTGKSLSPEHKAKIGTTLYGVSKTLSHCANISKGQRAKSPYKNLTAEINKRQLSYKSLAKILGLASQNISRKMLEQRPFTTRDKAHLVEIFNKPIEYLMFKEEFL